MSHSCTNINKWLHHRTRVDPAYKDNQKTTISIPHGPRVANKDEKPSNIQELGETANLPSGIHSLKHNDDFSRFLKIKPKLLFNFNALLT